MPSASSVAYPLKWAYGNADGALLSKAGRLYYARLVVLTAGAECTAVLRDGVVASAPPILALHATAGNPDDWPLVPVSMGFRNGLYVTFVGGTASDRLLMTGWEAT